MRLYLAALAALSLGACRQPDIAEWCAGSQTDCPDYINCQPVIQCPQDCLNHLHTLCPDAGILE
jgi:hypothetical protein